MGTNPSERAVGIGLPLEVPALLGCSWVLPVPGLPGFGWLGAAGTQLHTHPGAREDGSGPQPPETVLFNYLPFGMAAL